MEEFLEVLLGVGVRSKCTSSTVVRAMDWFPTIATFAGVKVPDGRVIDGRDIAPLLTGRSETVPPPAAKMSLNAAVPLRRKWNPPAEWAEVMTRQEYNDAFFYFGSQGSLAAVRWDRWKLHLNPSLKLFDLVQDPGERKPIRNAKLIRKLRGMTVLFQQEMRDHARPPGVCK